MRVSLVCMLLSQCVASAPTEVESTAPNAATCSRKGISHMQVARNNDAYSCKCDTLGLALNQLPEPGCEEFCTDNGCPCLRPWIERCQVNSCKLCNECGTSGSPTPTTQAPITPTPATLAPATPAPATPVPTTPSTLAPTQLPNMLEPTTPAPTTPMPTTLEPATPAPTAQTPTALPTQLPTGLPITLTPTTPASTTLVPTVLPTQPTTLAPTTPIPTITAQEFVGTLGTCTLAGDPHIKVFDKTKKFKKAPRVDIYRSGDYWIVKSNAIHIQGRYKPYSTGNAVIGALAVGGSFIGGEIIIEPMGGAVTWKGSEILKALGDTFEEPDVFNAKFEASDKGIKTKKTVNNVYLTLPNDVEITVNRWDSHIDVLILMRQQLGGQDGHCGNFNSDISDDTEELIKQRMGQEVPEDELLFASPYRSSLSQVTMGYPHGLGECPDAKLTHAEALCSATLEANSSAYESCLFDVCFAGDQFASQAGAMQEQENTAEKATDVWPRLGPDNSRCGGDSTGKIDHGRKDGQAECEATAVENGKSFYQYNFNKRFCLTFDTCVDVMTKSNWADAIFTAPTNL